MLKFLKFVKKNCLNLTDELAQKIDKECKTVDEWKEKLQNEINDTI